jgi:hypothetical protein
MWSQLSLVSMPPMCVAEKIAGVWSRINGLRKRCCCRSGLGQRAHRFESPGAPFRFYDKVATKFAQFDDAAFAKAGVRVVPPAVARRGAYIAPNVVLMPSYVNIGAYVDSGTMVDTWATVGSCVQIGKNVHLSGGVGIGGVLEPLQATPYHRRQPFHRRRPGRGRTSRRIRAGMGAFIAKHQDLQLNDRREATAGCRRVRSSSREASGRGAIRTAPSSSNASTRHALENQHQRNCRKPRTRVHDRCRCRPRRTRPRWMRVAGRSRPELLDYHAVRSPVYRPAIDVCA